MKKKAESTKENQSRSPGKPVKANEASVRSADDIISLILKDHEPLKKLIETLKDGDLEKGDKESTLEEFVLKLTNHAKAEEKTLYVQMKEYKDLRVESFEGDTEHAIADQLVQEINASPDDDEWNAKVKVLAEMVEHHIEEEEEEMFPEIEEKMTTSIRQKLGAEYKQIKNELDLLKGMAAKKSAPPKELRTH